MIIAHPPVAETKTELILPSAFSYLEAFDKSVLATFGLIACPHVIELLQDIVKLLRLPWRICEGSSDKNRGLSPWTDIGDLDVLEI